MIDDQALLRAYLETKDESAFAELVRRHLPMVHTAALRRLGGDGHHAADVAQQVFVALARDATKLVRHPSLVAWLYVATRNIAISLARTEMRRRQRELNMTAFPDSEPTQSWDRLRPLIDNAMDSLSDSDRHVVLLHYFQGLGFRDVGRLLGLSEDAARKRTERALEKLRTWLARSGVPSTSVALATLLTSQSSLAAPPALASQVLTTAIAAGNAATLGALTASTLIVMSPLKITTTIATATAILAVGWSLLEHRAARATQQELADLKHNLASKTPSTALRSRAQIQPSAVDPTPTQRTDAPSFSVPDRQEGIPYTELRRLQRIGIRAGIDPLFGAFFRLHGYSPEKIDQIKDLMVEGAEQIQDIGEAARRLHAESGKRPPPTTLREAAARVHAEEAEKMKTLLGPEDYVAWQDFAKTARFREITNELALLTYASASPLTATQTEQLVQILAASGPNGAPTLSPEELDWDRAKQQVGSVLSPAQQQMLEQIVEKRDAQIKLRMATSR